MEVGLVGVGPMEAGVGPMKVGPVGVGVGSLPLVPSPMPPALPHPRAPLRTRLPRRTVSVVVVVGVAAVEVGLVGVVALEVGLVGVVLVGLVLVGVVQGPVGVWGAITVAGAAATGVVLQGMGQWKGTGGRG